MIDCGHTFCEICIKAMIKNSNSTRPNCRTEFKNMNVGKLKTIYQLINEIEAIKPVKIKPTKKVAFNDTIDKLNEVNDQIRYLNYVLKQIDSRYLECAESIEQTKQKINENRDRLINEINTYSNSLIACLDSTIKTKLSYKNKEKREVKKMIQIREDLMNKIEKIFKEKYILKDSEKAAILALDYPEFNLEIEIFAFKVDQDKIEKSIEQCIGEIYSLPSNKSLKLCNDEGYKKYEENEKKCIKKSKSKAEIKSFFECNKVDKTSRPFEKSLILNLDMPFFHAKTPSNVERSFHSPLRTPKNCFIKSPSRNK